MADVPELSNAPAWLVGIGIGGAALWRIWRSIKGEFRADASLDISEKLRDDLMKEAQRLRDKLEEVEKERNSIVASEARLQSKVEALERYVGYLEKTRERLSERFDKAMELNSHLASENAAFRARLEERHHD